VFLGKKLEGNEFGNFVFDTGSLNFAVTATDCATCSNEYFTPKDSDTFKESTETGVTLNYGIASLTGYYGTDRICLEKDELSLSCVDDFRFLLG